MSKLRANLSPRESEYRQEIISFCGCGMLNTAAVMKFFGWSRNTAKAWLEDVPSMQANGTKLYTVSDIARKMGRKERES